MDYRDIPIWNAHKEDLGWLDGDKTFPADIDLDWTGELTKAIIYLDASFTGLCTGELYINSYSVAFSGTDNPYHYEGDVIARLTKGRNSLTWLIRKAILLGTASCIWSVRLYVETTGTITRGEPSTPDWVQLLEYGLLGVSIIGGAALVGNYLIGKRRQGSSNGRG